MREDNTWKLEDFLNVRSDPENKRGFSFFFDTFVTCVSGKKNWTPSVKVNMTISGSGRVSVSDEAFTELVLLNYWNRWVSQGKPIWTESRIGSIEFQGWSSEGHMKFNELFKRIVNQQNSENNDKVNDLFIHWAQIKYGVNKNKANKSDNENHYDVEEVCMDQFIIN